MKKIKIEQLKVGQLVELIDSIKKVDSYISLKVEPEAVKSSVYFPDKDAVKSISLPFENFFKMEKELTDTFKMCFYDGSFVNAILKRFVGPGVASAVIELTETESGELHAKSLTVQNSELKIKITCSDPETGFVELTDEQISHVFNSSSADFSFELTSAQKNKFESLFSIDADKQIFSINASDDGVKLSGSSYDYSVTDKSPGVESKQSLYKKFISVLDNDDYTVKVSEDRTFFESQQRDIKIVFANCES